VVNSILWGNLGGEVYFASFDEPSEITLAYTDIQGGILGINTSDNGTVTWLEGNLDQEPAFTDPASGDYTLTLNSPCVDAGTALFTLNAETLVELGPDDFLGEAPDMGVHESEPDTLFYFPLVLGRQWNYDSGFDTMRLTIIDSLLIDGLAYHRFDGWFSGEDFDTFRVEGNQTLVRLGSTDHVLYDYGASLGESWVFPHPPEGLSTITLIGIGDILVTPADTYAECYVFHRNIGADYEFVEWFAPEIGLVQRDVITFTGLHRYYLIGIENTVAYDFSGVSRPLEYQISSIYPNPFNPVTTIEYTLARKGQHTLKVYNLQGALVATLIDENRPASNYSFTWDAGAYPSGLYILQLEAGADLQTRKLLLIK